jgi:hypothetical protein
MATLPDDLERHLIWAARTAGLDEPVLSLTVALGRAAFAARLTPLALNPQEVRGRTERLKRQLVSPKVTGHPRGASTDRLGILLSGVRLRVCVSRS